MEPSDRPERPNLIFIYTDEQAVSTMASHGNNLIETPFLSNLSEKSSVFEQCYCSQPVSTPSRSSILTGLYPTATGCTENNIPLSENVKCLPELADFSGYETAHFGKWHLGDEVFAQHGFVRWRSIEDNYREYYREGRDRSTHSSYYEWLVEKGVKPDQNCGTFDCFSRSFSARLPEKYSKPAYIAQESSSFIRNFRENPFILYINFLEPHMPFFGPRDNQYDPGSIPLPANFDAVYGIRPLKTEVFRRYYASQLRTEKDWKELIAKYWGLVSLIDTHIGKILDAVENSGIAEKTIIVFTSDHGDMMSSHRLLAKCVQYQEAVRVPLSFYVPWLNPQKIAKPVSQVDIVPTILDLMGKKTGANLHGKSLVPELNGCDLPDSDVLIQWNGHDSGMGGSACKKAAFSDFLRSAYEPERVMSAISDPVRTLVTPEGWKMNCSVAGETELYNLTEDPGEKENIAGDSSLKNLMTGLYERLLACQERIGDHVRVSEPCKNNSGFPGK